MPQCSVIYCKNRSSTKSFKQIDEELKFGKNTFHVFPSNSERRELWIKAIQRENWSPTKNSFICSSHFEKNCFDFTSNGRVRLQKTALPTIFNFSSYSAEISEPEKRTNKEEENNMKEVAFETHTEIIDTSFTEQLFILNSELPDVSSIQQTFTAQSTILPSTLEISCNENNEKKNNTEEELSTEQLFILNSELPDVSSIQQTFTAQSTILPSTLEISCNENNEKENNTEENVSKKYTYILLSHVPVVSELSTSSLVQNKSFISQCISLANTQNNFVNGKNEEKNITNEVVAETNMFRLDTEQNSVSSTVQASSIILSNVSSDISTTQSTILPSSPLKRKILFTDPDLSPSSSISDICISENTSPNVPSKRKKILTDCTTPFSSNLESTLCAQLRKMLAESKLKFKQKMKNLQQNNRRKSKRVAELENAISILKKQNLTVTENIDIINNIPKFNADLIRMQLAKSKCLPSKRQYTDELRSFSETLFKISPAAYDYVREKFDSCLPHPKYVAKWTKSNDARTEDYEDTE